MSKSIKYEQLQLFEDSENGVSKIAAGSNVTGRASSKRLAMSITQSAVNDQEAKRVANTEEGQFSDVKAVEIKPSTLSKTLSAFANTDGGDLYIGVDEFVRNKARRWRGFDTQEDANGLLQCFESVLPLGQDLRYEFLKCDSLPGLVLHVQVNKTRSVVLASNSIPYVRRGAQNLPIDSDAKRRQLELAKGITTFESETISVPKQLITESESTEKFMKEVVPQQKAETWLKKQILLINDKPTVAGLLLFADEPRRIPV